MARKRKDQASRKPDQVPGIGAAEVEGDGDRDWVARVRQNLVAWYEQGEISDREEEHLGASDVLVTAYRKLLKEQIDLVKAGGEPLNVFRNTDAVHSPELRIAGNEKGGEAPVKSTMFANTVNYRENYHKVAPGGGDVEPVGR